ncbi:hypothetical protein GWI33_021549 [Rhynchophorus ferrugineus]|uniref:tRNA (uracil-O(2)-)-methyltransferase n=1 Tax=Rhynchophorus ferrugineus TaxID=354439 RepID=A0A834MLP0_RHYFE|nr:hypothetical protein GWI33_021549 [Rhynchophorus ferrugineus]
MFPIPLVTNQYASKLVKEWPKRCGTDPQKFVFEDIAIASYLICLWKYDSNINFVDCGCGNGLLVYLLNQEGYKGFGLDIRQRSIWNLYPDTTILQVNAVTPNSSFPTTTWILGNHSDELTPWIPIIASKSSPMTNFFVLPCCPFDLSGKKFIRTNTSLSTYADYLKYVENICILCGFEVGIDKLRIPSTKRTCFIGRRNKLEECQYQEILLNIDKLIKEKVPNEVTQREVIEKVRNCTQLDRSLITSIIKLCVEKLLSGTNYIIANNYSQWNKGIAVHLSELVKVIPDQKLKQLKKECGGFQTLLKNHRYIFELKKGLVQLRPPLTTKDSLKYKSKPCWFLENHPDGCLYNAEECGYNHK